MNYTCQTGICLTSTHSVRLTIHWFYLYDCYNNTISENEAANLFGGGGGGVVLSEPAVIGHSCCGVPANFLSVCLFVCLFFGEANKIKMKWNPTRNSSFLIILRGSVMHYNIIDGLKVPANRNRLLVCLQSRKRGFLIWQSQIYRVFSLTWPAYMQIYWNKRKRLHKKRVHSQRIGLGHQYGRRFIVLGYQYGRRDVMWKHSIDTLNSCHPSNFQKS